jgi:hypothetical protein
MKRLLRQIGSLPTSDIAAANHATKKPPEGGF